MMASGCAANSCGSVQRCRSPGRGAAGRAAPEGRVQRFVRWHLHFFERYGSNAGSAANLSRKTASAADEYRCIRDFCPARIG